MRQAKMTLADGGIDQDTLLKYARQGATQDYVDTIERQRKLERLFPGIGDAAKQQLVGQRMAKARAAKNGRHRKAG